MLVLSLHVIYPYIFIAFALLTHRQIYTHMYMPFTLPACRLAPNICVEVDQKEIKLEFPPWQAPPELNGQES